ncbi:carbohydrate kinase family protein [Streptomyces sp. PSKA30]|uniref:carbohydrate kinase family protein n=1 Tax=Streptomyces sp. PSKA30 TaxID=2874597 RepID=UPI001CD10783|nr:carbohydrate kinase family protein [Streptomyces sp. PSKA30]MBZ9641591.1 carbohydrate kinase family protein [Streptomyces sp. PSKA30]
MRIAVTGSIAEDHLMVYPGRFTEQFIAESLDKVSLSFLVDELEIRAGGVAANIAFGLGSLGLRPLLVGAVGPGFEQYRARLERHGVDTGPVRVSESRHTARFVCTTDRDHNQIGSFYAGAMSEARLIDLRTVQERTGALDLVVVSPNDPEAMVRHTRECTELGVPFVADPSQQLARMARDDVRALLAGPEFLFTNEYESVLIQERSGWTEQQILGRVGGWVITRGAEGAVVQRAGHRPVVVKSVPPSGATEPTGAGDAFRAGFLAAVAWGLGLESAARLGSALATTVLESTGTQQYTLSGPDLLGRIRDTYGVSAVDGLAAHLAVRR